METLSETSNDYLFVLVITKLSRIRNLFIISKDIIITEISIFIYILITHTNQILLIIKYMHNMMCYKTNIMNIGSLTHKMFFCKDLSVIIY